jgi:ribonuclease HII
MKGIKLKLKQKPRAELNDSMLADLVAAGYPMVAGVDEVGRGCLAGPVTAGAVILPAGTQIPGARDSKLLSISKRRHLAARIKSLALAVGIGWASHQEVDQHGLTAAVRLSAQRALENLGHSFDAVLLDGNHNYLHAFCHSRAIIKADNLCLSVACASIVAKVARDNYMAQLHRLYPRYGFDRNAGYATSHHLAALNDGLSPVHRRRFRPVMRLDQLGLSENLERGYVD